MMERYGEPYQYGTIPELDFVKSGYSVRPGSNGSFILFEGVRETGMLARAIGFSNHTDLVAWLTKAHAEAAAKP